jgi:hypothetical protein
VDNSLSAWVWLSGKIAYMPCEALPPPFVGP